MKVLPLERPNPPRKKLRRKHLVKLNPRVDLNDLSKGGSIRWAFGAIGRAVLIKLGIGPPSVFTHKRANKMSTIVNWLKSRLMEGSTFGAIAAVLVYFGLKPEEASVLMDAAVLILGFFGLSVKDKGDSNG